MESNNDNEPIFYLDEEVIMEVSHDRKNWFMVFVFGTYKGLPLSRENHKVISWLNCRYIRKVNTKKHIIVLLTK